MGQVVKTSANNIERSQGNNLQIYVDAQSNIIMILDQFGNKEPLSNYINIPSNVIIGKIKLTDANGDVFSNLAGALAYVQEFTDAEITEMYFSEGIFYFTVPENTGFLKRDSFCSVYLSAQELQFEDPYGLVTAFDNFAFLQNTKNNIVGDASFKEQAFYATTGNNTLGICLFTGSSAFSSSTGNNTLGNCIFEKGSNFVSSQGDNVLGDCQFDTDTIEGYNFNMSSGNNTLRNCTFNATSDFSQSTGNNTLGDCLFVGDDAFILSNGNNTLGICEFQGAQAFRQSTGNNNFAANSKVIGFDSFTLSTGNNVFGNMCQIGNSCFASATGNNIFGNECTFSGNNFFEANGKNVFGKSCVFSDNEFLNSLGTLIFDENCIFSGTCIINFSGDEIQLKNVVCGDDFLSYANPKIKISIYKIATCGVNFCLDFTGRIDITYALGNDETATLPADIFTTANICSIHIPNALQYNNAGGPDGDLVNLLANVTNPDSLITYD